MARSVKQKQKLLYLLKILTEQSDEEHCLSAQALIDALAEYDVKAERKSIYDDIAQLIDFGYDIVLVKAKTGGGYYLAGRDFELAELKLLVSMNSINDLVELGFIQESEFENISLHPIVQEITLADLKPSIANCRDLISSISSLCTLHGAELPFSKTMFNVIENIISRAEKDNTALYVLFLKNTFEAMEKERYLSGMQNIIREFDVV